MGAYEDFQKFKGQSPSTGTYESYQQWKSGHPSASVSDVALGSPLGRFGLGAASVLTGPFQLGANIGSSISGALGGSTTGPFSGEWVNRKMADLEAAKQRGMKYSGREGYDVAGTAGAALAGGYGLKGVPQAKTLLQRLGQGGKLGAVFGAATPVTSGTESFYPEKAMQTGAGAGLGAAIPVIGSALSGIGKVGKLLYDIRAPKGGGPTPTPSVIDRIKAEVARRTLTRYQRDITGEQNLPYVRAGLQKAREFVPGSKPTASQALAGIPAGSPLTAHQDITARTPGGVSALFSERTIQQKLSREVAKENLNLLTAPIREKALDAANAKGGVKVNGIINDIATMEAMPGWRTADVVKKTLAEVREKIASIKDQQWRVDARDLYTIRKELGNTIEKFSKETASWDKRLSSKLENSIQDSIDKAIVRSGGVGWKQYMRTYAKGMQAIDRDIERAKLALKPAQRTTLTGGANVSELERLHMPQMLSRPLMLANWLERMKAKFLEPHLDVEAAKRYLDPKRLADALKDVPSSQQQQIVQAIMQAISKASQVVVPQEAARQTIGPRQP